MANYALATPNQGAYDSSGEEAAALQALAGPNGPSMIGYALAAKLGANNNRASYEYALGRTNALQSQLAAADLDNDRLKIRSDMTAAMLRDPTAAPFYRLSNAEIMPEYMPGQTALTEANINNTYAQANERNAAAGVLPELGSTFTGLGAPTGTRTQNTPTALGVADTNGQYSLAGARVHAAAAGAANAPGGRYDPNTPGSTAHTNLMRGAHAYGVQMAKPVMAKYGVSQLNLNGQAIMMPGRAPLTPEQTAEVQNAYTNGRQEFLQQVNPPPTAGTGGGPAPALADNGVVLPQPGSGATGRPAAQPAAPGPSTTVPAVTGAPQRVESQLPRGATPTREALLAERNQIAQRMGVPPERVQGFQDPATKRIFYSVVPQ